MTMAPNETPEGNKRKNELFKLRDEGKLTLEELYELKALTEQAASHLTINYPRKG